MRLGKVKVKNASAFGDDFDENTDQKPKAYVRKEKSTPESEEFQYDEVYETLKKPVPQAPKESRKPKYISKLLESKKLRELERLEQQQERIERQKEVMKKDTEATEIFVSDSYKKHRQEVADKLGKPINLDSFTEHSSATNVAETLELTAPDSANSTFSRSLQKALQELITSKLTPDDIEQYRKRYFERRRKLQNAIAS
ncbi:hypothetical protein KL918_004447 [Ogataea parapolymorpha]|uniref:Nuclear speckle splicing regulatory protein 1 N-terminal domain-containing protein n=1 Tax=Ogataea parapolymorpha (strain ATCC 26012 / BCRC 20466 / JCM 22074 / NRRL Y-7560 / DL-1) TaxID=871575 RepID=W1QIN2_OGAPD|nr:hypothetical protein HPODL_00244 [Ogataea parapolymorpha DL-1]ESX00829.1 hypothetical protein HPODL_00244 [Ogataea parapolymorpha DL-1]KAG7865566.1 hypothetical protein KL918_004447 [Ogataea parapolymorpha]KAG7873561.1 hypothetical protein KL916_002165 [Ogataea parapolymorpha]